MASRSAAFNIIFGAKTDNLERALKTVDGQLRRTAASFNKMGRKLTVGLTAPLAAIGTSAFNAAADFEQEMAKVRAVSGATTDQLKSLSDNARKLGASTRYSASEVAGLQVEFAKLGFTADEITNVTGATLALAQASGSDLARSAEIAGSTLRAFGLDTTETSRVTDVMAASFSSSALDLDSFAEAIKYVAPVAKSAGISIEETSGYLALLANNGIKGSQAGTSLRRIISELAGTGQDLGEVLASTAGETLTLADAKDEVGRSAQSAFLILREGLPEAKRLTGEFKNSGGAAAEMASIMDDTSRGALARMNSALEAARISLGDALAPSVNVVAGEVEKLAAGFANLSPATQTTVAVVMGFASALGPALMGIGQMTLGLKAVVPQIRAMNLAIRANPIGALATALAIVGTLLLGYATTTAGATSAQMGLSAEIRQTNLALAKQSGEFRRAIGLQAAQATVADLRDGLTSLNSALENINVDKVLGGITTAPIFDDIETIATDAEGNLKRTTKRVQVGEILQFDASGLPGALRDELEGVLQSSRSILQGEAVERGLFGPDAEKYVNDRLTERLESTTRSYIANLETKRDEIKTRLEELTRTPVPDPPTTEVETPVRINYDLESDLGSALSNLGEEESRILGEFSLTGDVGERAAQLAEAYRAAAIEAAALGEVDIASQLFEQSEGFAAEAAAVDRTAASLRDLQNNLASALALTDATQFVSPDEVARFQSLAAAYRDAAAQAYLLGQTDLASQYRDEAQAAQEAADALAKKREQQGQTLKSNEALEQSFGALGSSISQSISSGVQAAVQGEQDLASVMQQIGRNLLSTLLAEAIGFAIRNAFQSASSTGPAAAFVAPAIASQSIGEVEKLFSKIPALASGGLTTGPTLALVGDNPGGKEAIIPLNRLESMMQSQGREVAVAVTGRLRGDDILVSSQRAGRLARRLNRLS